MSHTMDESRPTQIEKVAGVWKEFVLRGMSHVTHTNESRHTHIEIVAAVRKEFVLPGAGYITYLRMNKSCRTFMERFRNVEWKSHSSASVMSHT